MATDITKKKRRPFNGIKVIEILLGIAFIAMIGLLLLGFFPVSHPRLAQKAVEMVRLRGLDSCSIGKVTAAIWKGVSFNDIALAGKTPAGDRYAISMPAITIKCNLFMLGVKYRDLKKIYFEEFHTLEKGDRNDPVWPLRSVLRIVGASRYIKGATVSKADILVEKKKALPLHGKDISFDIAFSQDGADRFQGSFDIAAINYYENDLARQISGDFSYDSGMIALSHGKAKMFEGRMKLESRVDLEKQKLSSLAISIDNLDLSAWSRFSDTAAGRLGGKADCKLTLDSCAFAVDSLHGKGALSVSRFEMAGFHFQKSLVTMLMYPGLAHLNFRKLKADLNLKPGRIIETAATGEGDTLSVKADGWIRTDGLLNEKLECTLTKAGVAALPDFAQKTLEDAPGGGKALKCRVYGMIQNPKVSVESKVIIQKAVNTMFEEVKNNLQLWMR